MVTKTKKILVLGASGYVGARLSYLLAGYGYKITAVCFPQIPKDKEWISRMESTIVGDISSQEIINELSEKHYDIAINLVSLDHHDSNKAPNFVNAINVMPTWNLLEAFKKKKNLGKYIYFSTIHVYGKLPNKIIEESFHPKPLNPYGLTHFMTEEICNLFYNTSDINCINVRMSNSYGDPYFKDNNCWWLVVNDLCRTAFTKREIVLKSDGSALRDFIHYKDIFNGLIKIIENKIEGHNTFHLSSGKTFSILQLAEIVKKVYIDRYGENIRIKFPEHVCLSKEIKTKYVISNQKLKGLGFVQETDLETGINELFNYLEINEK